MDEKGKQLADDNDSGQPFFLNLDGGQLGDASKEMQKLILLCQEVGSVVDVVRHDKRNGQHYAFVNFETEESASKAHQESLFLIPSLISKLKRNGNGPEETITVYLSKDKKKLFIGNVSQDGLKDAVKEAVPGTLEVRLTMMETDRRVIPYTIGNGHGYREFIEDLRQKLATRKDGTIEYFTAGKPSAVLPTLKQLMDEQDHQWLHIELHTKKQSSNESWTTTLAIRRDNLYVVGFTGEGSKWFQLDSTNPLPEEYHATPLENWGVKYREIMKLDHIDQVKRLLGGVSLGKAFAKRAVRRLARYPALDYDDDNPTWPGLAGLIVLICESARMEPIFQTFAPKWDRNSGKGVLVNTQDLGNIWNWGNMSAALMKWKNSDYKEVWDRRCYVSTSGEALHRVRLVLNSRNIDGPGVARVEILAVSTNFDVVSIDVTDEEGLKDTIYKDEDQGKEQFPGLHSWRNPQVPVLYSLQLLYT
ncbi:hypothetical protein ACP70R_049723 [Stipagrostis hirtigluma subsp. patula]